jgi:pyridoxamine 5'-phosphate oxidase
MLTSILSEDFALQDPYEVFEAWYALAAQDPKVDDHTAMTLATASSMGIPSTRIVLLKGFDKRGFVFYTNLKSHKSRDLRENPHAELCFYWPSLYRQIRISGTAVLVNEGEADAYFASRGREKQLGAYTSHQSDKLDSRTTFDERYALLEERFKDVAEIPRPDFWGGWRIVPQSIEFWHGQDFRLHHRGTFTHNANGWDFSLVYP